MTDRKDFSQDPDRIEAQIGVTRSKISEDLRAIGYKLTPEHVKHELKEEARHMVGNAKDAAVNKLRNKKDAAMESVRENMNEVGDRARRAGGATVHFARDNAVPLALIGAGLAWLLASRRSGRVSEDWRTRRYAAGGVYGEDYGAEYRDEDIEYIDDLEPEQGRLREGVGRVKERVGSVASNVEHRAHELREQAGERVQRVKERANERLHQGADRARELSRNARYRARDYGERSREFAHESPLAVGAIAIATGIGVGMLLPETRKERELLGPTRDRLMSEAKDTAQQLKSTVKDTARELKTQVNDQMTH